MTDTMTPTNRPAAAQLCDIIVRKDATIIALTKQLKIATEALEMAAPSLARIHREHIATQALARIKEVG